MNFADKCEKLKNCEGIPGFLNRLQKSFALSDIVDKKKNFRILDYLIPSPVSNELSENFSELGQIDNRPFDTAIIVLNSIY